MTSSTTSHPSGSATDKRLIAHVTTAHPRTDTRIRLKEVATLLEAQEGRVFLYVQDGEGSEMINPRFSIVDTGPRLSRLKRASVGCLRMVRQLRRDRPDVIHFHDPEFLPWGLLMKVMGYRVIYDIHEDLPRQMQHSRAIPRPLRGVMSLIASLLERLASFALDGFVTATPEIYSRFPAARTTLLRNFPMMDELAPAASQAGTLRPRELAYVGSLGIDRGLLPILRALAQIDDVVLNIAGSFPIAEEYIQAVSEPGWSKVRHLGEQDREQVSAMFARSRAGLVLFQPLPNNIAGRPNKLFEYMSAGLPVIASDFPRWREIVDGAECGLLVDPTSPDEIAEAIRWILAHEVEADALGRNGRAGILAEYNWEAESRNLVAAYERFCTPLRQGLAA